MTGQAWHIYTNTHIWAYTDIHLQGVMRVVWRIRITDWSHKTGILVTHKHTQTHTTISLSFSLKYINKQSLTRHIHKHAPIYSHTYAWHQKMPMRFPCPELTLYLGGERRKNCFRVSTVWYLLDTSTLTGSRRLALCSLATWSSIHTHERAHTHTHTEESNTYSTLCAVLICSTISHNHHTDTDTYLCMLLSSMFQSIHVLQCLS